MRRMGDQPGPVETFVLNIIIYGGTALIGGIVLIFGIFPLVKSVLG